MLRKPRSSAACVISTPRPKTASELSAEGLWSKRNVPNPMFPDTIRAASLLSRAGRSVAGRSRAIDVLVPCHWCSPLANSQDATSAADTQDAAGTADAENAASAPDAENAASAPDAEDATSAGEA